MHQEFQPPHHNSIMYKTINLKKVNLSRINKKSKLMDLNIVLELKIIHLKAIHNAS